MTTQPLYRLAYASRSTFKPFLTQGGLDSNIAQILNTARHANKQAGLVGALYYGNGCFFQCLEGDKEQLDALYQKLLKDTRHTDLKILSYQPIVKAGFSSWEMKYATIDQEARSFLRDNNIHKFDPYKFSASMTEQLVDMLQRADEAAESSTLLAEAASYQRPLYANYSNALLFGSCVLAVGLFAYMM